MERLGQQLDRLGRVRRDLEHDVPLIATLCISVTWY
jgi:hypothetical protein